MPKDFLLPFQKKELIASETYAFYFDSSKEDLSFLPGQYIRMTLPISNPDERGISRFFSLTTSPLEKNYIRIITKIIKSTFKKTLVTLETGNQVKFFGPTGGFSMREDATSHVFLAGGIGITPFLSMISYLDEKQLHTPVILIVSFSQPEQAILMEEMQTIAKRNPNIKIIYTITQPELSLSIWNGEKGRISEDLLRKFIVNTNEPMYYISGPPAMVMGMSELVENLGVESSHILKESFVGY